MMHPPLHLPSAVPEGDTTRRAEEAPRRILAAASEALADHYARQQVRLHRLAVERTLRRPYSTVDFLRAETSAGEERLVLKALVHQPDNALARSQQNCVAAEFAALRRVYPRFLETPDLRVPRPVLLLSESEALVMEFVPGRLLDADLPAARWCASASSLKRLCSRYRQCGAWLRRFQEFSELEPASAEPLERLRDECRHRLRLIEEAADRRCPPELCSRVLRSFDRQLALVRNQPLLTCGRHRDFGPWNILVQGDTLTVFDFFGYERNSAALDPINFLLNLEQEQTCFTASPRRIAALRQSFLDGYRPAPSVPPPVATLAETLYRVMNVWACLYVPQRWHRHWESQRWLRWNLRWLAGGDCRPHLWRAAELGDAP